MEHIVTITLFKGYGAVVQLPPSECSGSVYIQSGQEGGRGAEKFIYK
jgi:hypothetical protein